MKQHNSARYIGSIHNLCGSASGCEALAFVSLWSDRHALQVLWCEKGSPPNAVFVVLGIYIGVIRHTQV